jgi:hypothetical protein
MSQMTATEYEAHLDFMRKRDAIITAEKEKTPSHRTARPVWHGYDRPEGQPLIYSQALTDLFAKAHPETWGQLEANGWFIEPNGDILNLWLDEAFVIEDEEFIRCVKCNEGIDDAHPFTRYCSECEEA